MAKLYKNLPNSDGGKWKDSYIIIIVYIITVFWLSWKEDFKARIQDL